MNRVLEFIIKAKDNISSILDRVISKFKNVQVAATEANNEVAEVTKRAASATDDFTHSLRQTGVNWEAIKKQEEEAKQRRVDLVRLNRELKKAEEEASRATGQAAKEAQDKIKMLNAGIKQLSQDGQNDFNAMGVGIAALNGNLLMAAKGAINMARQLGLLKVSAMALSGAFIAIAAVVKLFTMWKDSIEETRQRIDDLNARAFQKELDGVAQALKKINEETARSNQLFDEQTERTKAVVEAKRRQALAENEIARAQKLTGADAQSAASINQKFDEQANAIEKRFNSQLKEYSKKRQEEQIASLESDLKKVSAQWRTANDLFKRAEYEYNHNKWKEEDYSDAELSQDSSYTIAKRQYDAALAAKQEADKKKLELEDKIRKYNLEKDVGLAEQVAAAELKEQQAKDEQLRIKREENAKAENELEKRNAQELEDVWRDWYTAYTAYQKNSDDEAAKYKCQLLQEYFDMLSQCTTEAEREEVRAEYAAQAKRIEFLKQLNAEEKAALDKREAEEKAVAKAVHQQRVDNLRNELAESQGQQQAAMARVQAAKAAVSTAWGWYKDKNALKQQIASEESDIAAREQYAKDYSRLTHGRWADEFNEAKYEQRRGNGDKVEELMAQWRKGPFGLSVEDEATMRVALANEAEKQANMDLARVAENTDMLARSLVNIEKTVTESEAV